MTYHYRIYESAPAALVLEKRQDKRDSGGAEQNENELVLELLQDQLPQRGGGLFGDGCDRGTQKSVSGHWANPRPKVGHVHTVLAMFGP